MKKLIIYLLLIVLFTSSAVVFVGCNKGEAFAPAEASHSNWMNDLKDEVKLKDVVMQGSYAAGSAGMTTALSYQADSIGTQLEFGVRYFELQLSKLYDIPVFMQKVDNYSYKVEEFCQEVKAFVEANPSEFIIFDISAFRKTSFEPTLALMEQYLKISEKAVPKTQDVAALTMGDIRTNGWNYLILTPFTTKNATVEPVICERKISSTYSDSILFKTPEELIATYDKSIASLSKKDGLKSMVVLLVNAVSTDRFSLFKLNTDVHPLLTVYLKTIEKNPELLSNLNLIICCYSTYSPELCREIIHLNEVKGNFK